MRRLLSTAAQRAAASKKAHKQELGLLAKEITGLCGSDMPAAHILFNRAVVIGRDIPPPNVRVLQQIDSTFLEMLNACRKCNDMERALGLFKLYTTSGFTPSLEAYKVLMSTAQSTSHLEILKEYSQEYLRIISSSPKLLEELHKEFPELMTCLPESLEPVAVTTSKNSHPDPRIQDSGDNPEQTSAPQFVNREQSSVIEDHHRFITDCAEVIEYSNANGFDRGLEMLEEVLNSSDSNLAVQHQKEFAAVIASLLKRPKVSKQQRIQLYMVYCRWVKPVFKLHGLFLERAVKLRDKELTDAYFREMIDLFNQDHQIFKAYALLLPCPTFLSLYGKDPTLPLQTNPKVGAMLQNQISELIVQKAPKDIPKAMFFVRLLHDFNLTPSFSACLAIFDCALVHAKSTFLEPSLRYLTLHPDRTTAGVDAAYSAAFGRLLQTKATSDAPDFFHLLAAHPVAERSKFLNPEDPVLLELFARLMMACQRGGQYNRAVQFLNLLLNCGLLPNRRVYKQIARVMTTAKHPSAYIYWQLQSNPPDSTNLQLVRFALSQTRKL